MLWKSAAVTKHYLLNNFIRRDSGEKGWSAGQGYKASGKSKIGSER
jgi:hypothetical protein